MTIQATLLYRTLRPVDFSALIEGVNAWMGAKDMALHMTPAGDKHVLFSNPHFHAALTITHEKVDPAKIATALDAPLLQLKQFDYADALAAHRIQVQITVGDGPKHVSEDIRAWMNKMGKHQPSQTCPMDVKLVALNGIVQQMLAHDVPELVYWAQSDMLFTPDEVVAASDMLFPLPLVVSPEPLYGAAGETGVRLVNSDIIAGRTLVMEPCGLSLPESLGIAMWLLSQRVQGDLMLDHGTALDTPGFPSMYLRHEQPDGQDRKGRIVITDHQPGQTQNVAGMTLQPQFTARPAQPVGPLPTVAQSAQPVEAPKPYFTSNRLDATPAYVPQAAPAVAEQAVAAPVETAVETSAPAAQAAPSAPAPSTMAALHAAAQKAKAVQPAPAETPKEQAATPAAQPAPETGAQPVAQSGPQSGPEDPAPAAAAPKPQAKQQDFAKGWANAAQRANPFDQAAKQSAETKPAATSTNTSAAPAVTSAKAASRNIPQRSPAGTLSLGRDVPESHKGIDVAAGLARPAGAVPPAAAKRGMRGLLKVLPSRGTASMAAFFLVLTMGMSIAPRLSAEYQNAAAEIAAAQHPVAN